MIRLHVPDDLAAGAPVTPRPDQIHYLTTVMRLRVGDDLLVFNGRDGEWRARIAPAARQASVLAPIERVRRQSAGPDLDLLVALVRRPRLETIVEKAAELGARRVRLVATERTRAERVKVERLQAIAVEASEQTGRIDVPPVLASERLDRVLADWPGDRALMFCDEAGDAAPALEALRGRDAGPWAVLIGPEGGFSGRERALIRALPGALPVSLGPRVLRADTAAISALTLWQAALGDLAGA